MTATEQLKSILGEQYVSEDEDEYHVELKPGLTEKQLEELAKKVPSGQIPSEIKELLRFASGFDFYGIDEVRFDNIGQFGFEELFPCSVELAGDGFGNFWILDIDSMGNWGSVFYVCHDPAVIVKHSDNLSQFIEHIHDFGRNGSNSHLDLIHEKVVADIWNSNSGITEIEAALKSSDPTLKNFAASLPGNYVIADLRNKPINVGFAWGKYGPTPDKSIRHDSELIWGMEKLSKKGFFSKLFGK